MYYINRYSQVYNINTINETIYYIGQDAENALLKHINKPPMMPLKRKSSDISTETQLGIAFDHGIRTNSSR